eukprot:CAMPEP_0183290714 /NCGR_PEP_ID=MMETSP0160_2-20130417/339_1 /TAXON_ID=2839 ORGANISM="Odontella Sinensis, Strain Grunow 1884" /NCGR_SAMPLE_ID=MMETSP0160_2 /ASSEMBLY_ACC=CAM_ASM_000250 /LENGTH=181 /DNA_ID=CAMNT_0025451367 /DNA_START=111 /DNA_END=656 /DNA_ORIENTATION=-
MKTSLAVSALLLGSAAAFAPSTTGRTTTSLDMDRRAAFGQIGAAAAVLAGVPSVASADGAVSFATIGRARGIYGDRIAALKSAVDAGDFAAVAAEKNAFILFNSGAYAKDKTKKAAAIEGTNKIFAAIRSKDKAALSSAYSSYVSTNSINALPTIDNDAGQGYSGDYDYRARTKAGAIYVR